MYGKICKNVSADWASDHLKLPSVVHRRLSRVSFPHRTDSMLSWHRDSVQECAVSQTKADPSDAPRLTVTTTIIATEDCNCRRYQRRLVSRPIHVSKLISIQNCGWIQTVLETFKTVVLRNNFINLALK